MSFIDPYNIHTSPQTQLREQENFLRSSGGNYNYSTGTYGGYSPSGFYDLSAANNSLAGTAGLINSVNRAGQQAANAARIPNAPGLEAQSSKMIEEQLLGQLPSDVLNLIGQRSAETGISSGMPGSPASNASYLRALGLTSLQQQESGQRNLSAAYARNPAAPLYNAGELVITPYQAATLALQREQMRRSGGGGGGGGGGYRPAGGADQSTVTPGGGLTAADLFGPAFGRGTMYTPEKDTWTGYTPNYEGGPAPTGYLPTSSGSMYIGSREGYDPETSDWLGGGWMDEIFGNYGG